MVDIGYSPGLQLEMLYKALVNDTTLERTLKEVKDK